MDALFSLMERMNSLWVAIRPSPRPYEEDLLMMLERAVFSLQPAVEEAEAKEMQEKPVWRWLLNLFEPAAEERPEELIRRWLLEVKEACSKTEDELGNLEGILLKSDAKLLEVGGGSAGQKRENWAVKKREIASLRKDGNLAEWVRETREIIDEIVHLGHSIGLSLGYQITSDVDRPPVVYGRDDDKKKVISLLLSDHSGGVNVSGVWMVGAGGVGKTTLTHLVYNDPEVCNFFEIKLWVSCVSDAQGKGMLRSILESLTGISCYLDEIDQLQEALEEELNDKRFLLVLDDWDAAERIWNNLFVPLRAGAKGSQVIVTTRISPPPAFNVFLPYHLDLLSHRSCQLIFRDNVFGGGGRDPSQHPALRENTNLLNLYLSGVPLAAKALGGLGKYKNLKKLADSVADMTRGDDDGLENYTPSILRMCYDCLPMYLKRCFVYCSLFPKGYIFQKDHLVRLWMSQGFILPELGKRVEDLGTQYFHHLLSRSFFQYSPTHDPKDGKFVMHHLFHDLAESVSISGVECLRTEDCRLHRIPEKIRHTSFVPHEFKTMITSEPFKESKDMLTFILINRSILRKWDASQFCVENAILHELFLNFTSLRTLDLSNTNIIELPSSIENLKQLCYLALNNTNIQRLPESMCTLHSLQTLELQHCNRLVQLPIDTKNLANLRHLHVWKEAGFVSMPPGIGQLSSLQTLSTFLVRGDELQCGIGELKDLVSLRGDLCVAGLDSVISGKDAEGANLKNKEYLESLTLHWLDNGWDLVTNEKAEAAGDVLQSLQPHSSLQELIIRNYYGDHFPSWMGDASFYKLLSVTLDNCYGCKVLPPLGQLPSLRYVSIRKIDGVQFVGREFHTSGFPSLETLKIWEMYEWEEWDGVGDEDFPCLRSLTISRCPKLRRLPCITSLLELLIHGCTDLPGIPTFPCLKSLKIEGFQSLKSLTLPSDLPFLKMLEINYCNQLTSVVGLGHVSSVEQIKISKCPKLQFSPDIWATSLDSFNQEAGTRVISKLVRNTKQGSEAHRIMKANSDLVSKKQKIVIRVSMEDAKKRRKALKTVAGLSGVVSATLEDNLIVVIGDKIDPVSLTIKLRRQVEFAELVSVSPVSPVREKKQVYEEGGGKSMAMNLFHRAGPIL